MLNDDQIYIVAAVKQRPRTTTELQSYLGFARRDRPRLEPETLESIVASLVTDGYLCPTGGRDFALRRKRFAVTERGRTALSESIQEMMHRGRGEPVLA